ncbi:primary amine oxidase, partial [Quercus suber]
IGEQRFRLVSFNLQALRQIRIAFFFVTRIGDYGGRRTKIGDCPWASKASDRRAEPLTPSELNLVQTILTHAYPNSNYNLTFQYVGLPDKPTFLSWLSNHFTTKIPQRRDFTIARINHQIHELIVDFSNHSIISNQIYNGHGFPLLTFDEQIAAKALTLAYAPFVASVSKRRLKINEVVCGSFTVGWYGETRINKKVVKVMCFYFLLRWDC